MASVCNVMSPTVTTNLITIFKKDPRLKSNLPSLQHSGLIAIKNDPRKVMNNFASRRNIVVSCSDRPNCTPNQFSGYDAVMKFYSSINERNKDRLRSCISNDCFIDDFSFSKPFHGRNEAMKFFEDLVKSMGQNVKFCVENVCEGDGYSAAVNWHLEWKGRKIPFARGCSFYEFTEQGGKLVIRNARILTESPIKPGGIALNLLKNITFLFDEFPQVADWFLEKPYAIIQLTLRIYGLFLAPLIGHIMASYLMLLNNTTEFFLLVLKIIIKIRSFFSK
ncbi:hypothetical protein EUTSA_v10028091mg [Eutrema salsugineum]|uniref:SnoaL-like domain-containing protein n=1 Tax=Eutrema salsugineum TaxID=72664 RepID=V4NKA7_EUTSA|nr:uncharacterized protein LOC18022947 [Eutrema salsugineum]ESQ46801.1 hypothetical protein EUTSA_v10028091mg [Eutrema salsugineum]